MYTISIWQSGCLLLGCADGEPLLPWIRQEVDRSGFPTFETVLLQRSLTQETKLMIVGLEVESYIISDMDLSICEKDCILFYDHTNLAYSSHSCCEISGSE